VAITGETKTADAFGWEKHLEKTTMCVEMEDVETYLYFLKQKELHSLS
jgi:hypothetical protein